MPQILTFAAFSFLCIALSLSASVTNQARIPLATDDLQDVVTAQTSSAQPAVKRTSFMPPPTVVNSASASPSATSSSTPDSVGPQTDIVVLAGFLVDAILLHKEAIVNSIAQFITNLFGDMAVNFSRMAATVLGMSMPVKQTQTKRMDTNARGAQSGPMTDNYGYQSKDQSPFVLPILNRPIQYEDFQLMQRLVMESIDVYNNWQKKSSSGYDSSRKTK